MRTDIALVGLVLTAGAVTAGNIAEELTAAGKDT